MRILLILLIFLSACSNKKQELPDNDEKVADNIESYISDLQSFASGLKDSLSDSEYLSELYRNRDFQPFWFKKEKLTRNADTLIHYLENAHLFGLNQAYFRTSHLKLLRDRKLSKDSAAYYDILITDAFMKFMTEIHAGKIEPETGRIVYKGRSLRYFIGPLIETTVRKNQLTKLLHAFEPPHRFYRSLKEKLHKIAVFRNELYELAERKNLSESDTIIVNSYIREFKRYHQENPDLIPDPDEFNTIADKINYLKENLFKEEAFIRASLEKWRWEKRKLYPTYVLVNIASFNLYMFDLDNMVFSSRIVVGKPENQTPELESMISSVLIYPRWHVPYSIASKEILPLVQGNLEYLYKQNMEVLDKDENIVDPDEINWTELNEKNLPYTFRQREGESNALGVMKFYFQNRFGVYMHDTNEKRYFAKRMRAYSHGCMRIEKPKEFASILLRRADSLSREIDHYLEKRQTRNLDLQAPVPLFVKYFTAEVVRDTLHLYPDIYKKDQALIRFYSN